MSQLKIFSGRASRGLAEKIAEEIGEPLGQCEIRNFKDGEIWVKYLENIRGNDVFIIQSTFPPSDNLMELLIMIDAAKRASARRITAVIPYFGYARQDRKDQPRVPITSKLVANLITVAGADRVLTMDLHAPQIQGFFDIPFDHLYSAVVLVPAIREMINEEFVVVSPDIGGVKFARGYAKRLNAELILIDKRRLRANESVVVNVVGEVKGKTIIIVDDIIDTAGTFINAVDALLERGAKKIYGACTHPILSGDAIDRIENAPVEKILVTDTVPLKRQSPKIEVRSVAKIFAEAIKRIHCNESLSVLFEIEN
ncbi:ribose-phosphate pyrophosphokinase [Candidatus Kryptonium thompsonii]|uniref:Ribose-phosphate pyrophosphokinase n=1 Tax=Candidatus Kryptonium thompsonii TaxID=1633631 RepID=A0A0P1L5U1_9BACT|nr:ribose-phosphate pyrophosphokinase [Candidatus Kryptonium thompsoni]CUS76341.1 ribose-phosphate pyrophosphokinase [Candidatus Kryptonium thompsoni]CUS78245.1 ribose-phosphate pyrophosphokinase [Candidatus Kryptonium thompsoni]CUS80482.1 ribose-phosphate pyrophosphokinase [Candidatus Kryptonium thompsoni]CUS81933.1 ribose-phosphate pyrophosphokinase [Candidatus Kryptonium thompsoni]CUS91150.1 ribose-phosphate pyrophosphokinase [Candidatus Kryptonium thompsoni]